MSTISAQPACTLADGTQLPRIDYSCPGPGNSRTLRFRPTFTLCTKGGAINHIEVAEDVNGTPDQKMGDVDSSLGLQTLTEFGPGNSVVDTSTANKGCGQCHFKRGTVSTGGRTVNTYEDILPDRGILFMNDPNGGPSVSTTPLSEICTRLERSSQLASNPSEKSVVVDLCNALARKTP